MVVQHNIMAINSHRQLGINNTNLSGNLEKLSSGYRINRAADDAAGLAISEKMRAQITGLDRAILNAQDGASLIQTAEGALQEVHGMLNRMVELATQAANGIYQGSDRQKLEDEVDALKEEIDRISKATNFNGIQLLDGSLSDTAARDISVSGVKVTETAAVAGQYMVDAIDDADLTGLTGGDKIEFTVSLNNGDSFTANFEITSDGQYIKSLDTGAVYALTTTDDGTGIGAFSGASFADVLETVFRDTKLQSDYVISATGTGNAQLSFTNRIPGLEAPRVTGSAVRINGLDTKFYESTQSIDPADEQLALKATNFNILVNNGDGTTNEDLATFEVDGQKFILIQSDNNYAANVAMLKNSEVNIITIGNAVPDDTDLAHIAKEINNKTGLSLKADIANDQIILAAPQGNGLTMQVGDTAADFNKITVSVQDMSTKGLGIANISMASQESASRALDRINAAIEKVSVNRGALGALQNRLTYTINNLGVTTENMTAAESRIRDTDMAKEMMAYTKNSVLSQAAQAMLAQANTQPQNVLQLLR